MGDAFVSPWLGLLTLGWALAAAVLTVRKARLPAETDLIDRLWAGRFAVTLWTITVCTLVLTVVAFAAEQTG